VMASLPVGVLGLLLAVCAVLVGIHRTLGG
jgi:hypothetical protein